MTELQSLQDDHEILNFPYSLAVLEIWSAFQESVVGSLVLSMLSLTWWDLQEAETSRSLLDDWGGGWPPKGLRYFSQKLGYLGQGRMFAGKVGSWLFSFLNFGCLYQNTFTCSDMHHDMMNSTRLHRSPELSPQTLTPSNWKLNKPFSFWRNAYLRYFTVTKGL